MSQREDPVWAMLIVVLCFGAIWWLVDCEMQLRDARACIRDGGVVQPIKVDGRDDWRCVK